MQVMVSSAVGEVFNDMASSKSHQISPTVLLLTLLLGVLTLSALFVMTSGLLLLMLPVPILALLLIFQFSRFIVSTGRFRELHYKEAALAALILAPVFLYAPLGLSELEMGIRASMFSFPSSTGDITVISKAIDPIGSSMAGPAVVFTIEDYTGRFSEITIQMTPYSPYLLIIIGLLFCRHWYRRCPQE